MIHDQPRQQAPAILDDAVIPTRRSVTVFALALLFAAALVPAIVPLIVPVLIFVGAALVSDVRPLVADHTELPPALRALTSSRHLARAALPRA